MTAHSGDEALLFTLPLWTHRGGKGSARKVTAPYGPLSPCGCCLALGFHLIYSEQVSEAEHIGFPPL